MASVPNTTKGGVGAGGVLVVLLAIALALGAGHRHLAASSGGTGNVHVIPHVVGAAADPCRDKPDDHVVKTIRRGGLKLDCGQWRDVVRRIMSERLRPTIKQVLACIAATVYRGEQTARRVADSYTWRWGPGTDDVAVVMADAAGRIVYATAGGTPQTGSWRQCAQAAKD